MDEVEFSNLILSPPYPRSRFKSLSIYGGTDPQIKTGADILSQIEFQLRGDPSDGGKVAEILTAAHAIGTDSRLYFVYHDSREDYIQYSGTGQTGLAGDGTDGHGRYWKITIGVEEVRVDY